MFRHADELFALISAGFFFSQHFLTRVMSEQASRANLPQQRAPGSITPH
jgi:hypothetical protein